MIDVAFITEADAAEAVTAAAELGCGCVRWQDAEGLCLLIAHGKKGLAQAGDSPHPAACDWGDVVHKLRLGKPMAKDMLAKACLLTGRYKPDIIDATGGFGRDAWLLAGWGARLRLYERQPVMAWLLRDEINKHPQPVMQLVAADFLIHADELAAQSCDLVYLDPPFPPPRKRKAKSQKRMERLQSMLVSSESEVLQLLDAAMRLARYRVVLKRPKHAEVITPTHTDQHFGLFHLSGSGNRFDIYTKQSWPGSPDRCQSASQDRR